MATTQKQKENKMSKKAAFIAVFSNGTFKTLSSTGELKTFLLSAESEHVTAVFRTQQVKFERVEDVKLSE